MDFLISNATVINEGKQFIASVYIKNNYIEEIITGSIPESISTTSILINGEGKYLIPGIIDDQVHFREPGLTHKGDIYTESKAAVAGGITSYMEMPNTNPQTTTIKELENKFIIASGKSLANYSFYIGATNNNIDELLQIDPKTTCGVKVFMGSSTGNMLVDNPESLKQIFSKSKSLIATHCEDENTIKENTYIYKEQFGENIPFKYHSLIRSREACYNSSSLAVELAKKYDSRLHILHLSTADEIKLLSDSSDLTNKRITAEVCVHHLWFNDTYYDKLGSRIKWNPAVKTESDRLALIDALKNGYIDVVATDHAPHTIEEKQHLYFQCPSGGPLVQHSLLAMLELAKNKVFSINHVVEKMCHNPALLFGIEKRGFIRKGYYADLVLVDPHLKQKVKTENLLYKCNWSPFESTVFSNTVTHTFINGNLVYENGNFNESIKGTHLIFSK